ncbi:MAG: hypothetical protein RIE86_12965 [Imperialibacter sp.]|uniref:hypothetical protein n=1 Tax=Imperialibacter sp. TaxID=2038411 RepID=UPI0032EF1BA3
MRISANDKFVTLAVFFLLTVTGVCAQSADSLRQMLQAKGAENIQYFKDGEGCHHYFLEYRLHRNPLTLLTELPAWAVKSDSMQLTLLWNGMPWTKIARGTVRAVGKVELDYRKKIKAASVNEQPVVRSRFPYKIDISIAPVVYAEFGDEPDVVRTQFAIAPRINYLLPFGLSVDAQWVVPLQNDFERRLGFKSRPGQIGLNYTKSFLPNHLLLASVGTFQDRQYGGSVEYIIRKGKNYFGVGADLSASYAYDERVLYREPLERFSGGLWWMHAFPKHDLWTKITVERFIFGDYGSRVALYRQFGNNEVGFYIKASNQGVNGGIQWAMPLFPKAFFENSHIQIRPASQFLLTYEYVRNKNFAETLMRYQQTDRILRTLHPSFIKNHLLSLL